MIEFLLVITSLATGLDIAEQRPRGSLGYPSAEACALFGQAAITNFGDARAPF